MAEPSQINKVQENTTSLGQENGVINFLHIVAGGKPGVFGVLALDYHDNDDGITTYYYWPSTAGVLRYGSTMPTVATQNTAGVAVGTDA
jgi:hypothetical protein